MTTTETPPRTRWRPPLPVVIIAGVVAFVLAAIGLASLNDDRKKPAEPTSAEVAAAIAGDPVAVHISLTGGPGSAEVTFSVGSDTQQQSVDVPLTMKDGSEGLDVKATAGTFVYFSAQASDTATELECTMTAYGRTIAHAATSVDFGIVTCSASIPAA